MKLIIIGGVTGSIGQEILRKYLLEKETLIYGISRKGVSMDNFTTLPNHHMIVGLDLCHTASINKFISKIPEQRYESISYFHLVGEFKTEITDRYEVLVQNDMDGDGIDDAVYGLVAKAYQDMVYALMERIVDTKITLKIASFGSLADVHDIPCFQSFRKSREIVKAFSKEISQNYSDASFYLFNTSTILSADEMLERPFIFSTNVDPTYWITPSELVEKALSFMGSSSGIIERDIYLANPQFSDDYFDPTVTLKRRVQELYNTKI